MTFSEILEYIKSGAYVRREIQQHMEYVYYNEPEDTLMCVIDGCKRAYVARSADIMADDWVVIQTHKYKLLAVNISFADAIKKCIECPGEYGIRSKNWVSYGCNIIQVFDDIDNRFYVCNTNGEPSYIDSDTLRVTFNTVIGKGDFFDIYIKDN